MGGIGTQIIGTNRGKSGRARGWRQGQRFEATVRGYMCEVGVGQGSGCSRRGRSLLEAAFSVHR